MDGRHNEPSMTNRDVISITDLHKCAETARAWLFDAALPLWSRAGFDARAGLFEEKIDLSGKPVAGPRRLRVQARQTYVYAQAGKLGWPGPWRELVEAGLSILLTASRAEGGASGHLLNDAGELIDARRDLYGQAFSLFGLAHARTLDPVRTDARIAELFDYLETQRGPNGGFLEGEIKPRPRWQNPHMHLFEAGAALLEAGVSRGTPLAGEMAQLFDRCFFDEENGALGEYYKDDWSRSDGDEGRVCEPGHHFEWVWLLDKWRRLSGEDRGDRAMRLWAHAVANGIIGPVAIYETWRDGGIKTPTARLWAQTERLKAALVLFERTGKDEFLRAALAAFKGLSLYMKGVPDGLWRDVMMPDGTFAEEPAPASSFYHIILAYSELMRVAGL